MPSIRADRRRAHHRIVYLRPAWNAPGATPIDRHWIGRGHPFPPAGD